MDDALTIETPSLAELEAVIERGMETFVAVGSALLTIRDERLYRRENGGDYDTFEGYCRERWGFSDRHARRLIVAAEVVTQFGPVGPIPVTERQTRELARIPDPETRAAVWHRAVDERGESVTAADVRRIANEYRPQPDPPLFAIVDLETGEVVSPDATEDQEYRKVASAALDGGLLGNRVTDAIDAQRWGRAILQPVEDTRNCVYRMVQIDPNDALQAWTDTGQRDPLATVLRNLAGSIERYAGALEESGQQRLRAVK